MRARELKLLSGYSYLTPPSSRPVRARELKPETKITAISWMRSRPVRARELKLDSPEFSAFREVAPRVHTPRQIEHFDRVS